MSALSVAAAALAAFAAGALQEDPASREADMFGGGDDPPPADAAEQGPDEANPEPKDATTTPDFTPPSAGFTLLSEQDKSLAVGGQLFLRFNTSIREDDTLGTMPISSPSLLDAFMDARPSERVRGFAQIRVNYDFTVEDGELNAFGVEQQQFELLLDQLWMKLDLGRVAFVTAGRQRIRWGTGRFWNPTDFINTDVRNSVDFFDQRLGVNLLKVHFPFEQLGWNLYLLGTFEGIDSLEDTGVAARAELLFGEVEVALSSLVKQDAPLRFGLDASAGVWLFDLRGEMTIQRGLDGRKFEGDLDFGEGVVPTEVDAENDWFFRGVFGGDLTFKYSDQDTLIVGGEYFYNQPGYADAKLYPFLALNGAFTPLFLGQHYIGAYAVAFAPFSFNDTSITVSTLGNLSDLSFLSRLDVQQQVLTFMTFNAFIGAHYGRIGELHLGVDVDPIPGVLPDGFVLPTEMIDLGVALRMSL